MPIVEGDWRLPIADCRLGQLPIVDRRLSITGCRLPDYPITDCRLPDSRLRVAVTPPRAFRTSRPLFRAERPQRERRINGR
jgi:hypothetical protein